MPEEKPPANKELQLGSDQLPDKELQSDPTQAANILKFDVTRRVRTGPIPPAEELEKYEKLLPGLADRIVKMAEKEQTHQHDLQKTGLKGEILEARIGQILGFLIGFGALGYGSHTAIAGAELTGGFIGVGGIGSLVAVFVYGRKRPDKKNEVETTESSA